MAREREKRANPFKLNSYFDYTLFFLTVFLICFGLVMIYSTSSFDAQRSKACNFDAAFFMKRQSFFAALGLIPMFIAVHFKYKLFRTVKIFKLRLVWWIYWACVIMQICVFIFSEAVNGEKRWLSIGGITFQPSDFSKCAVIIAVSYLIYLAPRQLDSFFGFLVIVTYMLPLIGLIGAANLSTAIIICGIIGGICIVASRKKGYYLAAVALAGAAMFIFIKYISKGFRGERFEIWLNVETHEKGYQILHGLYAISSGGLTGTGLGESMQKLGFIPEAQNDMIFAIICEELGILGAIVILTLYAMLLYRIYIIAINAPDLFGSLICVGVMAHIAIQVVLNIAVVTNTIPSTGVTLPFISYGGTSLVILMTEIGLVLGVSNQIRHKR